MNSEFTDSNTRGGGQSQEAGGKRALGTWREVVVASSLLEAATVALRAAAVALGGGGGVGSQVLRGSRGSCGA